MLFHQMLTVNIC